jgi:hypothetical protein
MRLDHFHSQEPGVLGFKSNDLRELLSNRLGDPQRPPLVHSTLAISNQLSAQQTSETRQSAYPSRDRQGAVKLKADR